jgi:hypothetical protein
MSRDEKEKGQSELNPAAQWPWKYNDTLGDENEFGISKYFAVFDGV